MAEISIRMSEYLINASYKEFVKEMKLGLRKKNQEIWNDFIESTYSLVREFDFHNSHQQEIMITNGDPWNDTRMTRIRFNWTYTQQWGADNGWTNLHLDWMTWNGADAWGWGDAGSPGAGEDWLSWTDTTVDSAASWQGPLQFNHGNAYALRFDFDGGPGNGSIPNVKAEDFGLILDFEDGCQLNLPSIHKGLVTWTPTATPLPSDTPPGAS